MLADFHFLRPLWLLLLIVPFIGYYSFFFNRRNISAWESVCDKKLLSFLLVKGNSKQRSLLGYFAIIGIIGTIIALAGPSWQKKETPTFSPVNPVMILLNLSSDMDNSDLRPNRLARAKFAIDDLLKEIQAQAALIVYTNEPYIISPSTEDKRIISNLLPSINQDIVPENGDKLYRAIDLAVSRMSEDGFAFGNIVIFAPDVGQDFNKALSSAANAVDKGYNVNEFVDFLRTKKGEEGEDISNWSMVDLYEVVQEFVSKNSAPTETKPQLSQSNTYNPKPTNNLQKPPTKTTSSIPNTNAMSTLTDEDFGIITPEFLKCQKSETTELSKYNDIQIIVNDPQKVNNGFFIILFIWMNS